MAYDKKKIFQQSKELIEKHKLFFIEDIVPFLPCVRSTFYSFFPESSDELDILKRMLDKNKIEVKSSLRSKWYKSEAPALQLALMKIICTDDERKRLSMTHVDNTSNGKEVGTSDSVLKILDRLQK
jgi:hypothetical protein